MKALFKPLMILALPALVLYSCVKDTHSRECEDIAADPCGVDSGLVNIRVHNETGFPICGLELDRNLTFDSSITKFGFIENDGFSCFVPLKKSLKAPGIKFTVGNGTFVLPRGIFGTSFFDTPKSFITYNIQLTQTVDTAAFRKDSTNIILTYYTSSTADVQQF